MWHIYNSESLNKYNLPYEQECCMSALSCRRSTMWCGGMTLVWGSKILMSSVYPNPYEHWCVQYTQRSILLYEKLSPLSVPESRSPTHVPVSRNIRFRLVLQL